MFRITISVRKRGDVFEYRFEIATVEGKRKWVTKSGFKTKAEAFNEDNKISIIDFEKIKQSFVEREFDPINCMSRNPNSFNTNSVIVLIDYDFRNIMNFIKNNLGVINNEKFDERLLLFDCLNSLKWLEKYPEYELYNDILFKERKKLLR